MKTVTRADGREARIHRLTGDADRRCGNGFEAFAPDGCRFTDGAHSRICKDEREATITAGMAEVEPCPADCGCREETPDPMGLMLGAALNRAVAEMRGEPVRPQATVAFVTRAPPSQHEGTPEHTPGPWAVREDVDVHGRWIHIKCDSPERPVRTHGQDVAQIDRGATKRALADARLIASAPDLLHEAQVLRCLATSPRFQGMTVAAALQELAANGCGHDGGAALALAVQPLAPSAPAEEPGELDRLYAVAKDAEVSVLDELAVRAGLPHGSWRREAR